MILLIYDFEETNMDNETCSIALSNGYPGFTTRGCVLRLSDALPTTSLAFKFPCSLTFPLQRSQSHAIYLGHQRDEADFPR